MYKMEHKMSKYLNFIFSIFTSYMHACMSIVKRTKKEMLKLSVKRYDNVFGMQTQMWIKKDTGVTRTTMSVDLAKIKQTLHNA